MSRYKIIIEFVLNSPRVLHELIISWTWILLPRFDHFWVSGCHNSLCGIKYLFHSKPSLMSESLSITSLKVSTALASKGCCGVSASGCLPPLSWNHWVFCPPSLLPLLLHNPQPRGISSWSLQYVTSLHESTAVVGFRRHQSDMLAWPCRTEL